MSDVKRVRLEDSSHGEPVAVAATATAPESTPAAEPVAAVEGYTYDTASGWYVGAPCGLLHVRALHAGCSTGDASRWLRFFF